MRTLSILFAAYVLVVIAAAAFLSGGGSERFDATATRVAYSLYLVTGALVLVMLCSAAVSRLTARDEFEVPKGARAAVLGPALACLVVVAVSAALLPGSDGMLLRLSQINAFVVLGVGCSLVGLAAYAAGAIHLLRVQAA